MKNDKNITKKILGPTFFWDPYFFRNLNFFQDPIFSREPNFFRDPNFFPDLNFFPDPKFSPDPNFFGTRTQHQSIVELKCGTANPACLNLKAPIMIIVDKLQT